MPGKDKTGLSSFYIEALHLENIIRQFIQESKAIAESMGKDTKELESLILQWNLSIEFFQYSYAHLHVRQVGCCDGVLSHCSENALGGICVNAHGLQCKECVNFFNILSKIKDSCFEFLNEDLSEALVIAQELMSRYIAHTVRGRHQARALREIIDVLERDPTHLLIIIDHKQKVLPSENREAQEAYFGKKGE